MNAGYNLTAYRGAKDAKHKETLNEEYLSDEDWSNNPIWAKAVPGDLMKIFWDRNNSDNSDSGAIIGCNADKSDDQEHGHSVIFLGYTTDGKVRYWSSNGPGKEPVKNGYSIATCDKNRIQRVVFTRITNPENFNNAIKIEPTNTNKWLKDLDGNHHATTKELKHNCKIN